MFKFFISFPGLYMGWGLGSNHAATVFGPQVIAGSIRYRTATILAAIFILVGALLEGPKCFKTVGGVTNLIAGSAFVATLSAALMIHLMNYLKIPVSTTEAIVGALIGIGLLQHTEIHYKTLTKIFTCWVINPFAAIIIAYLLYKFLAFVWQKRVKNLMVFNRVVGILSIIIGCYAAYSLGANNVANATGAFYKTGVFTHHEEFMLALFGGVSISLGILTYSRRVMETVGKNITLLDPFSALVAILAGALILHLFAQLHIPVSSSQAIVGAVVGVGLVKGTRAIHKKTLIKIVWGWVFNATGAALLAFILGWGVRLIFPQFLL